MLYISCSSKKERYNSRHDVQLDIFEDLDLATALVCILAARQNPQLL